MNPQSTYPSRQILRIRYREQSPHLLHLASRRLRDLLLLLPPLRRIQLQMLQPLIDLQALHVRRAQQAILQLAEQITAPADALPFLDLPFLLLGLQDQGGDVGGAGVVRAQADVIRGGGGAETLVRVVQRHLRLGEVVVALHALGLQLDGPDAVVDAGVPCLQLDAGEGAVGEEGGVGGVALDAGRVVSGRRSHWLVVVRGATYALE